MDWFEDPNHPTIWRYVGVGAGGVPVYGLSDQFRNMFRPIFFKAYQCIKPSGPNYRYPNLEEVVEIRKDNTMLVPDPPNESLTAMHTLSHSTH